MLSVDIFKNRFREQGLRFTKERYAIYQILAASKDHPSVEDLYNIVKQRYPKLSLNTVYNTLEALKTVGVASEISLWHNKARFDGNLKPHHHLVCISCRTIVDLYDPKLDRLALSAKSNGDFLILGHRVEFQGYCKKCRKKASQQEAHKPYQGRHKSSKD